MTKIIFPRRKRPFQNVIEFFQLLKEIQSKFKVNSNGATDC